MKSKYFVHGVILSVFAMLLGVAIIQILIDPLFLYHRPFGNMKPVMLDERYQNAGMARNFDYDTVIIGNSMCENFQVSWFDEGLDCDTVKLVSSGSHPLDWIDLLCIINNRAITPKRIIMNLDAYMLGGSTTESRQDLPTYLYDTNMLNEAPYWWSFSAFNSFTKEMLFSNWKNNVPDYDMAFVWDVGHQCGKKIVRANYENERGPAFQSLTRAEENLELLLPFITHMDETEFIFFCSPWSMLYWKDELQEGTIDNAESVLTESIATLLSRDNVKVFFWHDDAMLQIMGNLDNYRDYTHYSREVSHLMATRICQGIGELSQNNYSKELHDFFEYARNYDYSEWETW